MRHLKSKPMDNLFMAIMVMMDNVSLHMSHKNSNSGCLDKYVEITLHLDTKSTQKRIVSLHHATNNPFCCNYLWTENRDCKDFTCLAQKWSRMIVPHSQWWQMWCNDHTNWAVAKTTIEWLMIALCLRWDYTALFVTKIMVPALKSKLSRCGRSPVP